MSWIAVPHICPKAGDILIDEFIIGRGLRSKTPNVQQIYYIALIHELHIDAESSISQWVLDLFVSSTTVLLGKGQIFEMQAYSITTQVKPKNSLSETLNTSNLLIFGLKSCKRMPLLRNKNEGMCAQGIMQVTEHIAGRRANCIIK